MRQALIYLQILLGTVMAALGINLFLVPLQLPSGGLGGLLLLFHYLWDIAIGPVYFAANLPALFWLYRLYGWQGLFKTVFGIATFSLALEVTAALGAWAPTQDMLLAAIFGGALLGAGVGLALAVGGDPGGNSTYARIIRHYTGMNVNKVLLYTDAIILVVAAVMLSVESILYGLVMTVVVSYTIQLVQDGLYSSRFCLIISKDPDDIGALLMKNLVRGVTRLEAQGQYTGLPRPVLMVVVSSSEVHRLKRLVLAADPDAFLLISDAREVSGRGFTIEHELRRLPYWVAQGGF